MTHKTLLLNLFALEFNINEETRFNVFNIV